MRGRPAGESQVSRYNADAELTAWRQGYEAGLTTGIDIGRGQAEHCAKHPIGVLAQQRRRAPVVRSELRGDEWHALESSRPDYRVVELEEGTPEGYLRVGFVYVLGGLHGAGSYTDPLQQLHRLVAGAPAGPFREVGVQGVLVGCPQGAGGESGLE